MHDESRLPRGKTTKTIVLRYGGCWLQWIAINILYLMRWSTPSSYAPVVSTITLVRRGITCQKDLKWQFRSGRNFVVRLFWSVYGYSLPLIMLVKTILVEKNMGVRDSKFHYQSYPWRRFSGVWRRMLVTFTGILENIWWGTFTPSFWKPIDLMSTFFGSYPEQMNGNCKIL